MTLGNISQHKGVFIDVGQGAKTGGLDPGAGTVRAAILAEVYFMQEQTPPNPPPADFTDWSRRGGEALGRAIYQWLAENA